jgi:hypothetical protein
MTEHEIPNSAEMWLQLRQDRYLRVTRFQGGRLLFREIVPGKKEIALELVLVAVTPVHVNYFLADDNVQKSVVTRTEIIQFLDQYDGLGTRYVIMPVYGSPTCGERWHYWTEPSAFRP